MELNLARALLRYLTCNTAVVARTKNRRYEIGKVNMRYNDIDKSDDTPFVDNAVKPPTSKWRRERYQRLQRGQGQW